MMLVNNKSVYSDLYAIIVGNYSYLAKPLAKAKDELVTTPTILEAYFFKEYDEVLRSCESLDLLELENRIVPVTLIEG